MKKVFNIFKDNLSLLIISISLCLIIFNLLSSDVSNKNVLGYYTFTVQSNSMSATDFDAGDLILVKKVNPKSLKAGDIISFTSRNQVNNGKVVTHKIRSITTDDKGNPGFVTYGTTTNTDDEAIVLYEDVIGQYKINIPMIGFLFSMIKTPIGYAIFIIIPFMAIIISEVVNLIKLSRSYKNDKEDEEDEEENNTEKAENK